MSLYLGPIHTWLWNKILFSNSYNNFILEKFSDDNINKNLNTKYPELSEIPLEEQIDETNIHGWLQDKINLVESRFAYTLYLLQDSSNINELKNLSFEFGKKYSFKEAVNPEEFYNYLNTLLLNGMPCDNVNTIISNNSDSLIFKQSIDIHSSYFEGLTIDSEIYYIMRDSLINGIISESNVEYNKIDENTYEITMR